MKRLLKGIALLALMFSIFLWIFLFTEPGLQLLIKTGERFSQGKLKVDETTGRLGNSFTISGLSYSDTGISLEIEQILTTWHPLALFRGEFHLRGLYVEGVKVVTGAEEEKTSDRQDGISLPEVTLPIAILLKRIEIKDVEIASGSDPITKIDRALIEVDGRRDGIKINAFEIEAKEYEVSLTGSIGMRQNWPAEIAGEWLVNTRDTQKLSGSCSLSGSLLTGKLKLDMTAPFIVGVFTDYSLADIIEWQSVFVASGVNPGLFADEFPGDLDMEAAVNGQFVGGDISADIDLKRIEGELRAYPVWLKSKMRFANSALEITELLIKSRSSKLVASGTLASDLDLDFDLSSGNIGDALPGANGQVHIQGRIEGTQQLPTLKASIQGEDVEGEGVAISSLSATVDGIAHSTGTIDAEILLSDVEYLEKKVDEAVLQLSGGLENHQAKLRLQQEEKEFSLDLRGKVEGQSWVGEVKDLFLSFAGDDAMRLEKPALLEISSQNAVLGDLCLLHEGGKVCLVGQWLKDKWQAEAEMLDFNPGHFSEDWPGTVNSKLVGQGDLAEDGGMHQIELQSLSGNLKGKLLSGSGFINVENSTLRFRDFFLQLGQANLAVEGSAGDTFDLVFKGVIPDISGFVPDSAGSFLLEGSLQGDRELPVIKLNFDVREGEFGNIAIAEVTGRTDIDLKAEGQISSDINVSGLTTEFLEISTGNVQINGTKAKHELQLALSTSEGDVSLKGEGGYESYWNGALTELSVLSRNYGEWFLDGDTDIVLGAEDKRMNNFCLGGTKAGICVDASYGLEKNWKLGVEVKSFDFSLFNDAQITTIPMQGSLQGTFIAEGQDNIIAALDAEYSVPHLLLSSTFEEETLTYSFEQNNVQLHLIEDSLNLNLQSQFQGRGNLKGEFKVSGVNEIAADFADNPLEGDLDLRINDLSFVTILSNSQVKPQGGIDGALKLSGSIAKPQIKGDLKLREGGIEVPQFGINVQDLEATIDGGQDGVIFTYSGKSGPGELVGKGSYSKNDNEGWQLKTDISGSDFEVIATEEYLIRVDPKLNFETDQDVTKLRGEVRIPYARISLEGGDGSISPSEDVVFIDDLEGEQQKKKLLETDLTIILGDDVKIDGFGLKSYLTGQLGLKDVPGKALSATGELVVKDGHFSFYSTSMEINRGRLLFTGGPVDDPKLDVLAQRTVDKKVVGVNVSGTVSDLEVQLFSDPVMEESEILSYIVVGAGGVIPVDEVYLDDQKDSENASIVVGKNLTEDLYIGYDHKFSDSAGEFKIRYKLGYGFSVETSSSTEATSGDIFYSLER